MKQKKMPLVSASGGDKNEIEGSVLSSTIIHQTGAGCQTGLAGEKAFLLQLIAEWTTAYQYLLIKHRYNTPQFMHYWRRQALVRNLRQTILEVNDD